MTMLLLIACLLVLTGWVFFEKRLRAAVVPARLGQMSERWLSEHRESHSQ